jgi:hypothetical protein
MLMQICQVQELILHINQAATDQERPEMLRARTVECSKLTEASLGLALALGYGIKNGEA